MFNFDLSTALHYVPYYEVAFITLLALLVAISILIVALGLSHWLTSVWAISGVVSLAAFVALALMFSPYADAQVVGPSTPDQITQWYNYVCGNDGAVFKFFSTYIMYPAFVVVVGAWANNSKWVQANPILGPIARFVGGHYAAWLRDAAKAAATAK